MGNKGVERAFENDGGRQIKGRKEKKPMHKPHQVRSVASAVRLLGFLGEDY